VFEGGVSHENNGGFASCRDPATFFARSAALLLTVRGDGQRYKLLESQTAADFRGVFHATYATSLVAQACPVVTRAM
jgi:hypothetical protein